MKWIRWFRHVWWLRIVRFVRGQSALVPSRYDAIWDTVAFPFPVPRGTERNLFRDRTGKSKIDFYCLADDEVIEATSVGVQIPITSGNVELLTVDLRKILEAGYLVLRVDGKDVVEGPLSRLGDVQLRRPGFGLPPVKPWGHIEGTITFGQRQYEEDAPSGECHKPSHLLIRVFVQGMVYREKAIRRTAP